MLTENANELTEKKKHLRELGKKLSLSRNVYFCRRFKNRQEFSRSTDRVPRRKRFRLLGTEDNAGDGFVRLAGRHISALAEKNVSDV